MAVDRDSAGTAIQRAIEAGPLGSAEYLKVIMYYEFHII
jgi:hypothetical protein